MRISILGCGGSKSKGSRPTAFLIDEKLLLDCGTATEVLSLKELLLIDDIIVSHAHFDHIGDLPFIANLAFDVRKDPVVLHGIEEALKDISSHIFNGRIWPDFPSIPNSKDAKLSYRTLKQQKKVTVGQYSVLAVPVNHTVPTVGYLIDDGKIALAYTGDTYNTDLFWKKIRGEKKLRAVIIESSFPNRLEEAARITGHLTPGLLEEEVKKLKRDDVEIYVSHIKPVFRKEVVADLRKLSKRLPLNILEDGMKIKL
jgi:ribonuclease BN (tRNA processing enzyme)